MSAERGAGGVGNGRLAARHGTYGVPWQVLTATGLARRRGGCREAARGVTRRGADGDAGTWRMLVSRGAWGARRRRVAGGSLQGAIAGGGGVAWLGDVATVSVPACGDDGETGMHHPVTWQSHRGCAPWRRGGHNWAAPRGDAVGRLVTARAKGPGNSATL